MDTPESPWSDPQLIELYEIVDDELAKYSEPKDFKDRVKSSIVVSLFQRLQNYPRPDFTTEEKMKRYVRVSIANTVKRHKKAERSVGRARTNCELAHTVDRGFCEKKALSVDPERIAKEIREFQVQFPDEGRLLEMRYVQQCKLDELAEKVDKKRRTISIHIKIAQNRFKQWLDDRV